jgi:penicillin-binding protein 2
MRGIEKRIGIAIYIVLLLFLVFSLRLWYLQILKGGMYSQIDEQNRLRVLNIPAPRGIIHDRNGVPLVKNIPSFDVVLMREDFPDDSDHLKKLAALIGMKREELLRKINSDTAHPFRPVVLKRDVSFREVARVEARKTDFPGLGIAVVGSRKYLYGKAASHVLGYLGTPTPEQLRSPEYSGVPPDTFIGQFGIEKVMDAGLRGMPGKKVIEVNALGNIMKVVRIQRPVRGDDVTLTIDIDLQTEAEESMKGLAGAVVAVKVDTGEVIALFSSPAFDPNLFSRGIREKDWKRLVRHRKRPLINRAIQSRYPPGSTFKIITAIAALEEGLINRYTDYYCSGSIEFGRTFRCWKASGHGHVDLYKAIVESCDVYFYEIGKRLDINKLAQYAFSFGLGRKTGIELEGEAPGIVPTTAWKLSSKGEAWFTGETLNTVIGQGYLSATPIQMARVAATVANGGVLHDLYLVAGGPGSEQEGNRVRIRHSTIRLMKDAMRGVVEEKKGTGRMAKSDLVSVGGKTGTTQVVGSDRRGEKVPEKYRDHAWFIAFAPVESPEIAVSVFVEHGGHGSTGAAPIAGRVIEAYFRKKSPGQGETTMIR